MERGRGEGASEGESEGERDAHIRISQCLSLDAIAAGSTTAIIGASN